MGTDSAPEPDYNEILEEGDDHFDEVDAQEKSTAEAFGRLGHKKEKRRSKPLPGEEIKDLNLTPMMDMMTILLVFLVQSFATDPSAVIDINDMMRPPQSIAKDEMKPATRVMINAEMIIVNDKEVASIKDLGYVEQQVVIPPLLAELKNEVEKQKALEKLGGPKFDGKLLIVAHQTTSYAILTAVLQSAGEAQFGEYQLVVMAKEQK